MAESGDIPTYSDQVAEYLAAAQWMRPADALFAHHVRALAARMDNEPTAALHSAYLQAISRLDARRPDNTGGELPGQTGLFDYVDG